MRMGWLVGANFSGRFSYVLPSVRSGKDIRCDELLLAMRFSADRCGRTPPYRRSPAARAKRLVVAASSRHQTRVVHFSAYVPSGPDRWAYIRLRAADGAVAGGRRGFPARGRRSAENGICRDVRTLVHDRFGGGFRNGFSRTATRRPDFGPSTSSAFLRSRRRPRPTGHERPRTGQRHRGHDQVARQGPLTLPTIGKTSTNMPMRIRNNLPPRP